MAIHKLTAAKIAKLTQKGMYGDGGGLWLQVTNEGAGKSWVFRWRDRQTGHGRSMGLGPIYKTDINEARDLAKAQWDLIKRGLDPVMVRDGVKLDVAHSRGLAKTVNEVIDEFLDAKINLKTRSKHTKGQAAYLLGIARRTIGDLPIQKVDTQMLLDTAGLKAMWTVKHRTAQILLGHIRRVFSLAIANKYYVGQNPARWEDHLEHILPASRDTHRAVHHPALPFKEVGRFMEELRSYEDRSDRHTGHSNFALLLEYIILTGCRIGEARLATWNHIDRQNRIWAVPAENHKTGGKTRAPILRPITSPMLAVLDEMSGRYPDHMPETLIFPSSSSPRDTPYNLSTPAHFLRRSFSKYEITVHGFRSTFTDWCRANGWEKELYDAQTGHVVGNAVAQAYARDQLVDRRRPMMEQWGQYCAQPTPEPIVGGANIESLAERQKRRAVS